MHRMPDSSYVHSYLAKILEERGDEGAVTEYATAVHLDPTNQDALRSYAEYLVARRDYHGALPVLRRLVQLAKKPDDVKNLMRAFIEIGDADEIWIAAALAQLKAVTRVDGRPVGDGRVGPVFHRLYSAFEVAKPGFSTECVV